MEILSFTVGCVFGSAILIYILRSKANQVERLQGQILYLSTENATLKETQRSSEEKIRDLKDMKDRLGKEFEGLANKIFHEKMVYIQKDNLRMLDPFKEKLNEFQLKVTQYREDEMKEATTLKTEIAHILKLNQKLSSDAENLTRALRGDTKMQGNWGELILEKVLEASGLRAGEEYVLQGSDMQLKDGEGNSSRPDVIIHLPEGKHIIIDSKVSLVSYERYISSMDEAEQVLALKDFTTSLKRHVSGLSDKKYHLLEKLLTPDFVLLFVPVEGAFATALQTDSEIFNYAWDRKIIIVSPTTLMVTLRTIESIWRQEKQNKNAFEIARQAGELYDKFVGFVADMEKVKGSMDVTQKHYDEAFSKLNTGRGNIVSRLEKLKELGAKATKQIELDH
jgi:DNA recombination protein RmuC